MEISEKLESIFIDNFWEILNFETNYLRDFDDEYLKHQEKSIDILKRNPKMAKLFDESEECEISINDSKDIIDYYTSSEAMHILEQQQMFKAGMKMAYFMFEDLNILKKKNDDISEN